MKRGLTQSVMCLFFGARSYKMVPVVGFELTTYRLQGGCSTTELNRQHACSRMSSKTDADYTDKRMECSLPAFSFKCKREQRRSHIIRQI
jgi:hypothetical protein